MAAPERPRASLAPRVSLHAVASWRVPAVSLFASGEPYTTVFPAPQLPCRN